MTTDLQTRAEAFVKEHNETPQGGCYVFGQLHTVARWLAEFAEREMACKPRVFVRFKFKSPDWSDEPIEIIETRGNSVKLANGCWYGMGAFDLAEQTQTPAKETREHE